MKILCFSDVHGNKKALAMLKSVYEKEKPEITLCAGDFTNFQHEMDKVLDEVAKLGNVYLIHGNHENPETVKKLCDKKGIHFIHEAIVHYKEYTIIGYGGGGFSHTDKEFERFWSTVKIKQKGILITHQPPYGTILDNVDGQSIGNASYTKALKNPKLMLYASGHMHENTGLAQMAGNTLLVNPGYMGAIVEI